MPISIDQVAEAAERIARGGAAIIREQRFSERQCRLAAPELLSLETAQPHDLNRLVGEVVRAAWARCQARDRPVCVLRDRRLPPVRMLVSPLRELLACLLDISAATTGPGSTHLITIARSTAAVVILERRSRTAKGPWLPLQVQRVGRIELLVGERTLRALGGHLRLSQCSEGQRAVIALPLDGTQPSRQRRPLPALTKEPGLTLSSAELWTETLRH
jgi:hypothetical protein